MQFPGPVSRRLIDELGNYVVVEPHPYVLDLAACEGMWLATLDGQRIFDWAGYYGSKLLGHNHPALSEADYVRRLALAANNKLANPDFLTPECLDYYRLVHRLAPACMKSDTLEVYAVNSGAEAVENMMKYFLNLHSRKQAQLGRPDTVRRFVYFDRAFHGRTVFALNVTRLEHDPIVTRGFSGLIPGNIQIAFPHEDTSRPAADNCREVHRALESLDQCLHTYRDEVVGIIVEPIQGAGGHRTSRPEFFQGLSRLAHEHDVLLGFDEVQTAGGQTGTVFAVDQFDLPHPPDAIAVAKKFANGAVYMRRPMDDRGVLDSTWGGSLADMVRFVQEWSVVEREGLIEQVPAKTDQLVTGLEQLADAHDDLIFNVRGMGLYQGFSMRDPDDRGRLKRIALAQQALLLLGAGVQSIRFRPVLDVSADDIDLMLDKLGRSLEALAAEKAASRTGA